MHKHSPIILLVLIIIVMIACNPGNRKERIPAFSPFEEDVAFLKKYSPVVELTDSKGKSKVAVMAGLQGSVMTSTAGPPDNLSYGWINRPLFESGDTSVHMNAFGGEERFWLGPEGGQFSIFFAKDSAFTFTNWHTPTLIDLDPWKVASQSAHAATFVKKPTPPWQQLSTRQRMKSKILVPWHGTRPPASFPSGCWGCTTHPKN